uniref:SBP-type domain-containing protein n=1 Tax=Ananas comosus var. bracteatus TaxID=296719 RepID=A0A6V7QCR8_ANACO|nr:unnamed protein product [Ananas comosus var. bracteatus]
MERKATSGESKRKETKPRREPPPSFTSAAVVAADDAEEEEEEDSPAAAAAAAGTEEEKKRRSGSSSSPLTSSAVVARGIVGAAAAAAAAAGAAAPPSCQAERCAADLTEAKRYHRRHKVCEAHSKAPVVVVAGLRQRFCQQCSRFHELSEFDDSKGAAAGAWLAITSGAERVLWRLREKARAAAGSPIRMEGFRSTSLETLRTSISRSDKHALSLLSCYAASNCANCCPISLSTKCIAVIAKLNASV